MSLDSLPPFPGFRAEAFTFLKDLAANNQRDWFKPRKTLFEDELIWPLRCLVSDLTRRMSGEGIELSGEPKKAIFRIYRDVRFSKNKEPYKRHVAAVLSRSGSKKESGGLYVHVEPGGCFVAAGFWQPEKELLRAWRQELVDQPGTFMGILHDLENSGLRLVEHDVLKKPARGFDSPDPDVQEVLRHKSFIVSRPFEDPALNSPDFADDVMTLARATQPLLRFGWRLREPRIGA